MMGGAATATGMGGAKHLTRPVKTLKRMPAGECADLELRKAGSSLREIAEETSLGLATVRTIVDQTNRWSVEP